MANFPTAASYAHVFLDVFALAQHSARDREQTQTPTPSLRNNFGPGGPLNQAEKYLRGFEMRMRTLGNYSIPS